MAYIVPMLVGISFTIIGFGKLIAGCLKPQRYLKGADIASIIIFLSIGLTATIVQLRGAKPTENFKHDMNILRLSQNDINSIEIEKGYNWVNSAIMITNSEDISSICSALKSATPMAPNHPGTVWDCKLTFSTVKGPIKIRVSSTSDQGVIVWLNEPYRCDEVGLIIEHMVRLC